ncbi:hypothetical protein GQ55_2G014900 [Panicum hallii var. hallii]|uniref:F-box domain-containing protein n=1 Tax=Panicum hallii var. hallii TaxID=1504633 RepID=A0A2T7EKE1_9POAL|nr:hypothetical protein GQ55_2G014900 [Panicum hallii var. hallii]
MALPRPPPELVADIVGEILLLLPPDDPASLVRASLVCKPWRPLLSDPAFRRRYRAFHGAPPPPRGAVSVPRFFPATVPSPIPQPALGYREWSVIDCRHGRVLFDVLGCNVSLVVWDPVIDSHHVLPEPPIARPLYGAAVLCAARGCDHLDCHGGPFLVVLAALNVDTGTVIQAHVYSSEARGWNVSTRQDLRHHIARRPSTLIGDAIYFRLHSSSTALLRYDLGKNRDDSLGFAGIRGSQLCLWSRNVDTEVGAGWE